MNKTGWAVYNGFWNPAPPAQVEALIAAAAERGWAVTPVPNTALTAVLDGGVAVRGAEGYAFGAGDAVFFWDKDVRLARALQACGAAVYNAPEAIAVCDDKAATHLALAAAGMPMPETLVAPMTYDRMGREGSGAFMALAAERLGFPCVVKECYGSLGGQVYLAASRDELWELAAGMGARPFIIQRFIEASAGVDRRLYVVGERVAAAMERRGAGDFRANVGGGGTGTAYMPTAAEEALALGCARVLGLDFGGVDLLADGTVCEVNSNAFFAELERVTGADVAGEIVQYVMTREVIR